MILVIKVGTSSICDESTFQPKLSSLALLVETISSLQQLNHKVVLVSSGAIGTGLRRLNHSSRPTNLSLTQAVAAVGQVRLMTLYDSLFSPLDIPIAQILLTRDNLAEKTSFQNAKDTINQLLLLGSVPIINENDSVTSSEIRFGDNDSLSAIVAGMIQADYLFLLTDVDSLYTDNPRRNPLAERVKVVTDISTLRNQIKINSTGSTLGTGGMVTKLIAAELSTSAGCSMFITIGNNPSLILKFLEDLSKQPLESFIPSFGTLFLRHTQPIQTRHWWILHSLATSGSLHIDKGAVNAIRSHSSLFAAGVVGVKGSFNAQQSVEIFDGDVRVGKGIVNYSNGEIERMKGLKSTEIEAILGYIDMEYVIHRDNLAFY